MFNRVLAFSIQQRWLVMLVVLGMALLGLYNFRYLPIDAVPDITNVQVQINTVAPGYSPLESEQQITYPIEFSLAGLPRLDYTRSLSRYGLSQVTVVFKDGTDIYFARQLLSEKLQEIRNRLPAGLEPRMGPIATGLGEIYMWVLEADPQARKADGSPYSPMDLRTLQDWVVRPQLKTVPGVTEVNTIGGYQQQFQISPYPEKLRAYGLSFHDVVQALKANNQNVGAGYIEREGAQYLLRMPGRLEDIDKIEQILLTTRDGVPVQIKHVALVELGKELRTGAATYNGRETVLGTAMMLIGENSREVSEAVHHKLESVNDSLPQGVQAVTVYNRSSLVDKTLDTVTENLSLGALLVIVVLFLFLGNFRAALITALVIPLAMCFTVSGMLANQISANLMSLGALDFGIIVDGSVVIAENCIRHLAEKQRAIGRALTLKERMETVFEASKEARQALLFGELIIIIVYIPILALEGVEGKMFHPMALTVILALVGALILSMTFVPAALALFMGGRIQEKENRLVRSAKAWYQPTLNWALTNRLVVLTIALVLVLLCGLISSKMGREFVPSLDEGDYAVHALRVPGTGLEQAVKMQFDVEAAFKQVPEVTRVFSRIGTAEVASDPMPPNVADTFVMLKPRSEWPNPRLSRDALTEKLQQAVAKLPGNKYEFTQPIQMRFNELISGVRADVAVKLYGDDLAVLLNAAARANQLLMQVPGSADVRMEQVTGLPILTITPDRKQLARYGLNLADVQEVLEIAGAGKDAGEVFQGDRRFPIVVRLTETLRSDIRKLKQLPVPLKQSHSFVPLAQVARFEIIEGPNQLSRENGKRRIVVSANVRGRDLGGFVEEAQETLRSQLDLPAGYWLDWGGEFEKLQSASQRLQIVIPLALILILLLLHATLKSLKDALLVFSGVPLALTGGILALVLRGLPLSISAGVGFIALSGVAVLNGLVMLTFITQLRQQGTALLTAINEGAITRLRPVLMTALVASLGFVPMALATGTGAEVQRPLATVVIGGILSSTLLTLLVLPVLYSLVHRAQPSNHLPAEGDSNLMNKILYIVILLGAGLWLGTTPAQTAEIKAPNSVRTQPLTSHDSLSLKAAQKQALNYYTLQISAQNPAIQKGRENQAGRGPNPSLMLGAEEYPSFSGQSGEFNLLWQQPLVLSNRLAYAQRKVSQARVLAELELTLQKRALKRDVTQAFYAVLTWQTYLEVSEELLETARTTRQLLQHQYRQGKILLSDFNRARLVQEDLALQTQTSRFQLKQAQTKLALYFNQTAPQFKRVSGRLEQPLKQLPPGSTWFEKSHLHPEIQKAQAWIQLQQANLDWQISRGWPDLRLNLGLRYLPFDNNLGGLSQLTWPLPISDGNQGNIAAAQSQLRQDNLRQKALETSFFSRLRQALLSYQQAVLTLENYQQVQLPLARENLRLSRLTYEAGKTPYLGLLDAQKTLYTLQQKYLLAWGNYYNALAEINYFYGTHD